MSILGSSRSGILQALRGRNTRLNKGSFNSHQAVRIPSIDLDVLIVYLWANWAQTHRITSKTNEHSLLGGRTTKTLQPFSLAIHFLTPRQNS